MVKIDVITGFLGSGKTTFIKKVLELGYFQNEKLILIENEFGEIAIDGSLFADEDLQVYEISKGCICCSLKGEFIETLERIIKAYQPKQILIEPSGIFVIEDLFDILKQPQIADKCYLNGIHTIVDTKYYRESKMRYSKFFHSQISAANNLILSKCDDYHEHEITKTIKGLKEDNPKANVFSIPFKSLTNEDLKIIFEHRTHIQNPRHEEGVESHHAEYDIQSMGIQTVSKMTIEQFEGLMDTLRSGKVGYVIRLKGYLIVDDKHYCVNYAYGDYSLDEVSKKAEPQVSIIGDHMDKSKLAMLF
ncbi:GTP-binding protein [Vallitalea pronyensis]|uniref:GTP-binding protein n=1 Tax=Vallitalea pronyensis TaxID=1348613 RepID=A0A8J8MN41_9FIRM|nr:GTP-binding protein [Vallitalea pronyensis]QUI24735.1 GTP-binding protein [Vallitalea pronyensis]